MKPIKITEPNAAAIGAALRAVNGRAETHAYTTHEEIQALTQSAERQLDDILYKQDWAGAQWTETSSGKVANSYRYTRDATRVTLERRSSAWYLIEAVGVRVGRNGGGAGRLSLTPTQHEAATRRLAERYTIRRQEVSQ